MEDRVRTFNGIKCPYCDTGYAVKLWFFCGGNQTSNGWVDFATTDPDDMDCLCNVYACPQCGRVAVLNAGGDRR